MLLLITLKTISPVLREMGFAMEGKEETRMAEGREQRLEPGKLPSVPGDSGLSVLGEGVRQQNSYLLCWF